MFNPRRNATQVTTARPTTDHQNGMSWAWKGLIIHGRLMTLLR
jgi:hypothetical protein